MNDGEKATIVLNYLEECDSKTVINVLSACADDYQLAMIYDKLTEEGIIDLPNDEDDAED